MDFLNLYQRIRSVHSLYPWQMECLGDKRLIDGRENFVLWLPTGAGKTLVAELLMLRETLQRRRNCMLILPYVAIVQEKITALASVEEELGVIVEEYAASKGRFPPIRRPRANSIYVCTIEKSNGLVNSLIETGKVDELGMVIVDEVHMLGELGGRGAILEQCLCKVMFRPNSREHVQVIGMSATLGNPSEVCRFLGANLFRTNFRPVALVERIKVHDKLYRLDEEGNWRVEKELGGAGTNKRIERRDPDGLVTLLGNLTKGSVLIFCPTKQSCENVCRMLTNLCPKELRDFRSDERKKLLDQLKDEHGGGELCPLINASIRHGIAYHHSGLTGDERQLVESAYKSGVISVICCTSTLAAGVNLPARRVIIRSPHVGREPLRKAQYLQMVGRAGRPGMDQKGDSIVILHHGADALNFKKMHEGPIDPCTSGLEDERQRESFFLDLVVLKICHSFQDLHQILCRSLFGIQHPDKQKLQSISEKTIQSLVDKQMLIRSNDTFSATQIGSAAFNANLNPQMALDLGRDLGANLGQGIVLSSHFHLLYNCVPLDVEVEVDWNIFHSEYLDLSHEERQLVHTMGFPEASIINSILNNTRQKGPNDKATRIYVVFMLRQIWNQKPLWEVARTFGVPRGWLQSMLQTAISQSSSIVRFAERTPNLWALRSLLPEMVKRLSQCKHQELVSLLCIECVKIGRARQLYDRGYRTVGAIARAEPAQLISVLGGKLSGWQARKMINSAKAIIRDQIAEKFEELAELGAEDVPLFPFPISNSNAPDQFRNNGDHSADNNTPPLSDDSATGSLV